MKTNVNKVELVGFAGMDAELVEINKNVSKASFSLATSEGYKNKTGEWTNSTSWHRIVVWNEKAKKAAQEIKKGNRVSITGKLNSRTYQTNSGEKRYITEVIATEFEILPKE
ncbi:MAG: single-stranded DNA-binding protein [Bacteroidales bacterium]|nr:single-stranded DNA-binding protein [Bacteroidales bacterium]